MAYAQPLEVESVIQETEEALQAARKTLQPFYSIESSSIAHRATVDLLTVLEHSESIGHITILDFVFIPLSFVTSVVGRNMEDFGSGNCVSCRTILALV